MQEPSQGNNDHPEEVQNTQQQTINNVNQQNIGNVNNMSAKNIYIFPQNETYPLEKLQELAEQGLKALKHRYCSQGEIKRIFGKPLPIAESYINLSVIVEAERKPSGKEEESAEKGEENKAEDSEKGEKPQHRFHDERLSSYEDLFGEKRSITLPELFEPTRKKTVEKEEKGKAQLKETATFCLIQGRAGIGKTTFTTYLCHQWASDQLWPQQFTWVFHLPLRRLGQNPAYQKKKSYTLENIIYYECLAQFTDEVFQLVWQQVISKLPSEKILYVLDGYDEITAIATDEKHPLYRAFKELLYVKSPVILTSRPYGFNQLPQQRRNLEIIGFTNDNIEKYVQQFFTELGKGEPAKLAEELKARGELVLKQMRGNPSIWGTAHIPISLNLLCGIYQDVDTSLNDNLTMTELYQRMELQLLHRASQKETQHLMKTFITQADLERYLNKRYEREQQIIQQLAFEQLQNEQLVIEGEALRALLTAHFPIHNKDEAEQINQKLTARQQCYAAILALGFIRPVNDGNTAVEFLHLTFQEYFAAKHLAQGLKAGSQSEKHQQAVLFIQENKYNPRYQVVFWFVAGLLMQHSRSFSCYLDILQNPATSDLIGHYAKGLEIRVFEEGLAPNTLLRLKTIPLHIQKALDVLFRHYFFKANGWQFKVLPAWITLLKLSPILLIESCSVHIVRRYVLLEKKDKHLAEQNAEKFIKFLTRLGLSTPLILDCLEEFLKEEETDAYLYDALTSVRALGELAATPKILQALANLLVTKKKKPILQAVFEAVCSLGKLVTTPEILQGLVNLLNNPDEEVRMLAAKTLGYLDKSAVTPAILKALWICFLEDEWFRVRAMAAQAMRRLGWSLASKEILKLLLDDLLSEPGMEDMLYCYLMSANETEFLNILADSIAGKNYYRGPCKMISSLGESAATPEILQALASLLTEKDQWSLRAVQEAMFNLGSSAATPELLDALADLLMDHEFRHAYIVVDIVNGMSNLAATSKFLEILTNLLTDNKNWHWRFDDAIELVKSLGRSAATPEILQALADLLMSKANNRLVVIEAVGSLGSSAATPEILQALVELLNDKSAMRRSLHLAAIEAVRSLGESAAKPQILQALANFLLDQDWEYCRRAGQAIGSLGKSAATPQILQALVDLLAVEEERFCQVAVEAVGSLGKLAATLEILQALASKLVTNTKDESLYAAVFSTLGQLSEAVPIMLNTWQQATLFGLSKQPIEFLSYIILCAYFSYQVQFQVIKDNLQRCYKLQGWLGKQAFSCVLTPQQAQWLRHLVPAIVKHWETNLKLLTAADLLKQAQALPPLTTDPLMPEQHARFISDNNNSNLSPVTSLSPTMSNPIPPRPGSPLSLLFKSKNDTVAPEIANAKAQLKTLLKQHTFDVSYAKNTAEITLQLEQVHPNSTRSEQEILTELRKLFLTSLKVKTIDSRTQESALVKVSIDEPLLIICTKGPEQAKELCERLNEIIRSPTPVPEGKQELKL